MSITIGFIGYGEVGATFACDLLANGAAGVVAYDILFDAPQKGSIQSSRARENGVRALSDASEVIAEASVVISAVTALSAEAVAREAAGFLKPGQIFLDVNSVSPATKRRAAEAVASAGAHYVEGAVMAPVAEPRLRVSILAGGPAAGRAADLLNPLGMNIRVVSEEVGRASAMKLCRSIMIKGIEALIIDCTAAAKEWDVEDEVFDSLRQTFPSIDWPALSRMMTARVRRHGHRRAAEMREAAEMMSDLRLAPGLCRAIADRHDAFAD